MHVELSRTYPVRRARGFEFFMDVGHWSDWTTLEVAEPGRWAKKGDVLSYVWKGSLPGLPIRGEAILLELKPDEMVRFVMKGRGLPEMPVECRFAHAGPSAFTLTLKVDSEDPGGFFGDALQRLMFIEQLVTRDMRKCLEGFAAFLMEPVAA